MIKQELFLKPVLESAYGMVGHGAETGCRLLFKAVLLPDSELIGNPVQVFVCAIDRVRHAFRRRAAKPGGFDSFVAVRCHVDVREVIGQQDNSEQGMRGGQPFGWHVVISNAVGNERVQWPFFGNPGADVGMRGLILLQFKAALVFLVHTPIQELGISIRINRHERQGADVMHESGKVGFLRIWIMHGDRQRFCQQRAPQRMEPSAGKRGGRAETQPAENPGGGFIDGNGFNDAQTDQRDALREISWAGAFVDHR